MEGKKRGVGNVSFRWWRKPERTTGQPQGLLTTFSQMDNHIGDSSHRAMVAPRGDGVCTLVNSRRKFPLYRDSDSQPDRSLDYKPNKLTNCAVSAPSEGIRNGRQSNFPSVNRPVGLHDL